ncbi:putative two-component system sensor protein histidine kinase [Algibacter lectus]|uniref:Putative two-component system sensor protein histidine kinase n=1 Tax=Algibacter lectus TaxID=221126 RepID=A0A090X032_9FLAO|nr:putative two-component system sensor protein histidine kinase [Algibacter lectus]
MAKSVKYIIVTFILGCLVFLIGGYLYNEFEFKTFNDLLISFVFYQLYAFVLGYSNMFYFDYLENRTWKQGMYLKRIAIGIAGSTVITLIGLFIMRAVTNVFYFGNTFSVFLANQRWQNYQFGLWITLTIVIGFHVVFFTTAINKTE